MRGRVLAVVGVLLSTSVLGGCGGSDPAVVEVTIDRGSEEVMGVGSVSVRARPGDTVRITNGNAGRLDGDAAGTVVHALVGGAGGELPPLFLTNAEGATPNAGVWGACRGGDADEAVGNCPILPVDGPRDWDGTSYWSTGASLPGESRDVPLSPDIADGTHTLTCVLHPALEVDVIVGDTRDDSAAAGPPAPAESVVPAAATPGMVQVAPGDARTQLNRFWPSEISVPASGSITWTTDVAAPHDVVLGAAEPPELVHSEPFEALPDVPDGPWDGQEEIRSGFLGDSPDAPGGSTLTVTFASPGTYPYYCRFHPTMTGTVVVT